MKRWLHLLFAAVITMNVSITAYTPYENGSNISAIGQKCVEGRTCALNNVPFGSVVEWNGQRWIVEDRVGYSGVLDLFMEDYQKAIRFGRRNNQVIKVYLP